MIRVVGYSQGKRIVVNDGPARGRMTSGGIGGAAIVGEYARTYDGPQPQLPKLVTPPLRGAALAERKRK